MKRAHAIGIMNPMIADESRKAISARVNELFVALGFSEKPVRGRHGRIARAQGVSRETVRKWLSGDAVPKTTRLSQMAASTSLTVDYILTGRPAEMGDHTTSRATAAPVSSEPTSERPLDRDIIKEILQIIERRRQELDDPALSPDTLATIIANSYGPVAQEKKRRYQARIAQIVENSLHQGIEGVTIDATHRAPRKLHRG